MADVDSILERSAEDRDEIKDVIIAATGDCGLSAAETGRRIEAVVESRRGLLDELTDMALPANAVAAEIVTELEAAIRISIESNEHWIAWVDTVYTPFMRDGAPGCADGGPPHGDDFVQAVSLSDEASARKGEFVDLYNPVAEAEGMRVWAFDEI